MESSSKDSLDYNLPKKYQLWNFIVRIENQDEKTKKNFGQVFGGLPVRKF
jgi:hypothetical protein